MSNCTKPHHPDSADEKLHSNFAAWIFSIAAGTPSAEVVHTIQNKSMTRCGIKTDLQFSDRKWYFPVDSLHFCSAEWQQLQLRVAKAESQPSLIHITFIGWGEQSCLEVEHHQPNQTNTHLPVDLIHICQVFRVRARAHQGSRICTMSCYWQEEKLAKVASGHSMAYSLLKWSSL